MHIAVGLDSRLDLSAAQLRDLAPLARDLGYQSIWTNAGTDYDPVGLCIAWHALSGLPTGISVVPIQRNPPQVLGLAARTAHGLSGGAFTLGIGSGNVTDRPIAAVRDYVAAVRTVAPDVRVILGALGPQMLRLAGRVSAGAAMNWCTPRQIAWSRDRVGEGKTLVMYLRVCVDADVAAARRTVARQIIAYAVQPRPSGSRGYPAHFARMGFADEVELLLSKREAGANDDDLARVMPERLLTAFGYAGNGDGAREWLEAHAAGLDVAIVRVLSARPGERGAVEAAMRAFAPR